MHLTLLWELDRCHAMILQKKQCGTRDFALTAIDEMRHKFCSTTLPVSVLQSVKYRVTNHACGRLVFDVTKTPA